jgi:hypothetical protein
MVHIWWIHPPHSLPEFCSRASFQFFEYSAIEVLESSYCAAWNEEELHIVRVSSSKNEVPSVARRNVQHEDTWTIVGDCAVQPFNIRDDNIFRGLSAVGALDEGIQMSARFSFASLPSPFGHQRKSQLLSKRGDCAECHEGYLFIGLWPQFHPFSSLLSQHF